MDTDEHKMEVCKIENRRDEVFYQQVNMQGQAAIKAALLINGGASVAMLAFIGTAINNGTDCALLLKLCSSMRMFIFGVLSVAVASGVTYLAGFVNSRGKITLWLVLNIIAVILVVIGYILFAKGSLNAYHAFTSSLS